MPGPTSAESRKHQAERAFDWWSETVLGNPGCYSKLKLARYRAGIYQRILAARVDISPGRLSLLEQGGVLPKKAKTRQALAEALAVKVGDLFDD
jgi:DNA-binding XRE family transcriptional regulator